MFLGVYKKLYGLAVVFLTLSCSVSAMIPVGPRYLDNGECLNKQEKRCSIGSWSGGGNQTLYINKDQNQNMHLSQATFTFSWPEPQEHYFSNWMQTNQKGDDGWRVLGEPDNYQFKIKDQAPVTVEMEMKHIDASTPQKVTCAQDAPLRLGTSYYDFDRQNKRKIVCKVPGGYFPTKFIIKANIDWEIQLWKPSTAKERQLTFPGAAVKIQSEGCSTWTNAMGCGGSWTSNTNVIQIMNGGRILLNDRQCALKIPQEVKFGTIPTNSVGTIKEVDMPINVTCQGFEKTNNGPHQVSGLGIKSQLYAVKIRSLSGYLPGDGSNKTIGLQTDGQTRSDLYVDASLKPNQKCGVDALFTNDTSNPLTKEIILDGSEAVQSIPLLEQPKIYWRLCNPTNQILKEGEIQGSAAVSIDYR